mmetsp:Transcript_21146/g.42652  ORF Transcript_21146/g.42652 Transcript_21146/m.42652 type:complete len:117 (+) Transcript_21146:860-1210(+)
MVGGGGGAVRVGRRAGGFVRGGRAGGGGVAVGSVQRADEEEGVTKKKYILGGKKKTPMRWRSLADECRPTGAVFAVRLTSMIDWRERTNALEPRSFSFCHVRRFGGLIGYCFSHFR